MVQTWLLRNERDEEYRRYFGELPDEAPSTHESSLPQLADRLQAARGGVDTATAELRSAVRAAVSDGVSKYRVVQLTGLARATVDAWLAAGE